MIARTLISSCLLSVLLCGCGTCTTRVQLDPKLVEKAKTWQDEPVIAAKQFRATPQTLQAQKFQSLLQAFKLPAVEKWTASPGGHSISQGTIIASYREATSELTITDTASPEAADREPLADSAVEQISTALLRKLLPEEAANFAFTNKEVIQVQRESDKAPHPAFYFGRFVRKIDGRLVLGAAFQLRIGFGANQAIRQITYSNAGLGGSEEIKTDSRVKVYKLLQSVQQGKNRLKNFRYPYSPDHLPVQSLMVTNVFHSYVLAGERTEKTENSPQTLVPVVTVLAVATVGPVRGRKGPPELPSGPLYLHFNFPCTPGFGLCWPGEQPRAISTSTQPKVTTPQ
jgi:hypothetical protein